MIGRLGCCCPKVEEDWEVSINYKEMRGGGGGGGGGMKRRSRALSSEH